MNKIVLDKTPLTEIRPEETIIPRYIPSYEELQKELDKYKNIVDEVLESVCCIEHNLDKYEEIGLDHLEYAQNKIAELKEYLIELKGE